MVKKPLTPKKLMFAQEYLIDQNATQAAKRTGYSEKTAYSQGQRLLKDVEVREYIQKAQEKRVERTERSADEVIARLWKMHDIDFGDYETKRISKTIEMLARHYGLFNDKLIIGIDEHMLNTILEAIPNKEWRNAVRAAIVSYAKSVVK